MWCNVHCRRAAGRLLGKFRASQQQHDGGSADLPPIFSPLRMSKQYDTVMYPNAASVLRRETQFLNCSYQLLLPSNGGESLRKWGSCYRFLGARHLGTRAQPDTVLDAQVPRVLKIWPYEIEAGADCLQSYLEDCKHVNPAYTAFISRNASSFVRKLVSAVKHDQTFQELLLDCKGKNSKTDLLRLCTEDYLNRHDINEVEPFLESIGLDPTRIAETLASTSFELDGDCGLLALAAELERHGLPMTSLWQLIEKDSMTLLKCTPGDLRERMLSLQRLGVQTHHVVDLLQVCPKVLRTNLEEKLQPLLQCVERIGLDKEVIGSLLRYDPEEVIGDNGSKASDNIQFLWDLGVSTLQISKTVQSHPQLVVTSHLAPKMEQLQTFGIDIRSIVVSNPSFLGSSPEKNLQPRIEFLEKIGVPRKRLSSIFQRCPQILGLSIEKVMLPRLQFLRDRGVAESSFGSVIDRCPHLLYYSIQKNMMPKIAYLESLGVDIKRVFEKAPGIMDLSVKSSMVPKVEFLLSIGVEKQLIGRMISSCPVLMLRSLEGSLKPTLDFFRGMGLQDDKLCRLVVSRPRVFTHSVDGSLAALVKLLLDLGFEEGSMAMANGVACLFSIAATTVRARYDHLLSFGFSRSDVTSIVVRQPTVVHVKEECVTEKMNFFRDVGLPLAAIVRTPAFLSYSLEQRIKPRWRVIQWLKQAGHLKRDYSWGTILVASEKLFAEQFLRCHPEANAVFIGISNEILCNQSPFDCLHNLEMETDAEVDSDSEGQVCAAAG